MHEIDTLLDTQVGNVGLVYILWPIPLRVAQVPMLEHFACSVSNPLIVVILSYLQISKIITKTIKLVVHPRNNYRHVIHVISKFAHAQLHPSHASIENLPLSDFLKPSTSYSTFISGSIIFVHPCYSH